MKMKKGDNVVVLSGKEKGKQGRVIKVLVNEGKIIVENINLKKKHQKPKTGGRKGEKIEVPRPLRVSSVMLVCKSCGKPTRVGYKILPEGKKIRSCKKCGLEL